LDSDFWAIDRTTHDEPKVHWDPDQADPKLIVEGDRRHPVGLVPPLEGNPDGPGVESGECKTRTIRVVSQQRNMMSSEQSHKHATKDLQEQVRMVVPR
jgi:hypothetical protein